MAGPGQDDLLETITVRDHMEEYGLRLGQDLFYYLDKGGQHSEQYWCGGVSLFSLFPAPSF